jgi:topoisomerase-4 subunit A
MHAPTVDKLYPQWYLDYATYVILERAVPHLADGLKPVQRRILHAMHRVEDGRYNKVAGIVGDTMHYHPHGDASIYEALVQLGQKGLLIDTKGNWGNVLTGDPAAAGRYIGARLTDFAKEVMFNPKTTQWQPSYDGRKTEPVTLPVKFPLLLAQGVEGIAVGLACRVLPHNFHELLEACIAVIRNEKFQLQPDFPTGGLLDLSEYENGKQGGKVRVRAKIDIDGSKLVISQVPYGKTTDALRESILAANHKGKIHIAKIEDNTSDTARLIVHVPDGVSPEAARDALFAFTDCESTIPVNACVIHDGQPRFMDIAELLRESVKSIQKLLQKELEIKHAELSEKLRQTTLEKIFIENKVYQRLERANSWEEVHQEVRKGMAKFLGSLTLSDEDIARLTEIKIKRISKFDSGEADKLIIKLNSEIEHVKDQLAHPNRYAIAYFKGLLKKYGPNFPKRQTTIAKFTRVVAQQAAIAAENLYFDKEGGYAGYGIRKGEIIGKCSVLDDIIVFRADGTMSVHKVGEKVFLGKAPIHCEVFERDVEKQPTYLMVYTNGEGETLVKKFKVAGITRDKIYHLGGESPNTKVHIFSKDPADFKKTLYYKHLPAKHLRKLVGCMKLNDVEEKGRGARGYRVTERSIEKVWLE